jgi:hypothetical protein
LYLYNQLYAAAAATGVDRVSICLPRHLEFLDFLLMEKQRAFSMSSSFSSSSLHHQESAVSPTLLMVPRV